MSDDFDDFDDVLRSRLQSSGPGSGADARQVFSELQPAMRRAKIRRTVGTSALAVSLLAGGGAVLAVTTSSLSSSPEPVDILMDGELLPVPETPTTEADQRDPVPDQSTDLNPTTTTDPTRTTVDTQVVTPVDTDAPVTTAVDLQLESGPATSTAPSPGDSTGPTAPSTAVPQPTTTSPAVPTTSPSTTSPPATSPPTTVAAPPSRRTIQSACGSVTVSFTSSAVTLDATSPASGFAVDVKKAGPDKVEVKFEAGELECEIKAELDGGQLVVDVENPDDD